MPNPVFLPIAKQAVPPIHFCFYFDNISMMGEDFSNGSQTVNRGLSEGAPCPHCIVLADDHFFFRRDLRKMLERRKDLQVVGEANDGLELLEIMRQSCPHLVILDISMPNMNGIETAREIMKRYPGVSVLMLSMHKNTEYLDQSVAAGAKGYLLKENIDENIFSAIDTIKGGGVYFAAQ
jgi:DNA-binding NarL/FixJ family response regulator